MGWQRRGRKVYYYRTTRINGRFVCQYLGTGPAAEEQVRRVEARKAGRVRRRRVEGLEARIVEYCEGIGRLFVAARKADGWYLHYGAWRRRGPLQRRITMTSRDMDRLIGEEKARRAFEAGNVAELVKKYGGQMADNVIELIVAQTTDDPVRQEALRRHAAMVRDELAGPAPTAVEKVLAERIAVCYLDAYYADLLVYGDEEEDEGTTVLAAEYYQRRQDRAHRRYMNAIEELARVRRMETASIRERVERLRVVGCA